MGERRSPAGLDGAICEKIRELRGDSQPCRRVAEALGPDRDQTCACAHQIECVRAALNAAHADDRGLDCLGHRVHLGQRDGPDRRSGHASGHAAELADLLANSAV